MTKAASKISGLTSKVDRNRSSTGPTPSPARARAREVFLATLAATCQVAKSARAAKIDRTTAYAWRDADPDFRKAWERAIEIGVGRLEDVATARAVKDSDSLLVFLLRAHKPEKYCKRSEVQLTGSLHISLKLEKARERAERLRVSGHHMAVPSVREPMDGHVAPSVAPSGVAATNPPQTKVAR